MRETYYVTLERPDGVTRGQMCHYIKTAVGSWAGGGDPESPFTALCDKRSQISVQSPSHRPEAVRA